MKQIYTSILKKISECIKRMDSNFLTLITLLVVSLQAYELYKYNQVAMQLSIVSACWLSFNLFVILYQNPKITQKTLLCIMTGVVLLWISAFLSIYILFAT